MRATLGQEDFSLGGTDVDGAYTGGDVPSHLGEGESPAVAVIPADGESVPSPEPDKKAQDVPKKDRRVPKLGDNLIHSALSVGFYFVFGFLCGSGILFKRRR
jgi:hypothetical protein